MWKEHFKNLLGNSPEVTDKPIQKIINYQLDIKLGLFTQHNTKKNHKQKLPASAKYPQKYGRQGNLKTYCSDSATLYITRTQ